MIVEAEVARFDPSGSGRDRGSGRDGDSGGSRDGFRHGLKQRSLGAEMSQAPHWYWISAATYGFWSTYSMPSTQVTQWFGSSSGPGW